MLCEYIVSIVRKEPARFTISPNLFTVESIYKNCCVGHSPIHDPRCYQGYTKSATITAALHTNRDPQAGSTFSRHQA